MNDTITVVLGGAPDPERRPAPAPPLGETERRILEALELLRYATRSQLARILKVSEEATRSALRRLSARARKLVRTGQGPQRLAVYSLSRAGALELGLAPRRSLEGAALQTHLAIAEILARFGGRLERVGNRTFHVTGESLSLVLVETHRDPTALRFFAKRVAKKLGKLALESPELRPAIAAGQLTLTVISPFERPHLEKLLRKEKICLPVRRVATPLLRAGQVERK